MANQGAGWFRRNAWMLFGTVLGLICASLVLIVTTFVLMGSSPQSFWLPVMVSAWGALALLAVVAFLARQQSKLGRTLRGLGFGVIPGLFFWSIVIFAIV